MTEKKREVNPWRAGCGESRMPGSEGGVGKQARDHVGQPKRSAPTLQGFLAWRQDVLWQEIQQVTGVTQATAMMLEESAA